MRDPRHKLHFVIFALSVLESDSMAGGYRIFIECLRHWLNQGHTAELITSQQGQVMTHRYLQHPSLKVRIMGPAGPSHNPGSQSLWHSGSLYVSRALNGVCQSLRGPKLAPGTIVYSTTPFWPDVFPALVLRLRNPGALWLVAFSMFAPPIFGGWLSGRDSQTKRIERRALALKANEFLVYPVVKRWADIVYVNNDMDLERIRADGVLVERTLVVGGGVDVELSDSVPADGPIKNDAVFVGRFHPQKGVLELVDIWQRICQTLPQARLVMIGNGPLENAVAQKIQRLGMERNILLVGFKDGVNKIRIFRQSRIVVHPSLYDSGGMAAAEAMVCGLPGVSFDLPALRTYYPKGMLKAQDQEEFVKHIIHLLTDSVFCQEISREAQTWARSWDWCQVSQQLLEKCQAFVQEHSAKSNTSGDPV
jgi:glycosyltransferase involved in cell wall biosynthesis